MKKIADAQNRENSIVRILEFIIEKISYQKWLEVQHNDVHKARWDNVKELLTQASDFQGLVYAGHEDESLPLIEGLEQEDASDLLSRFLANVALASEVKKEEDQESNTPQITISTIHAAKGLEWPIVFIPGAYQGSIPHSRAEDTDEERRLLYVAMTRAKALLYMSCPLKSSLGELTTICPFLSHRGLSTHLDQKGPSLGSNTIQCLAQILRRSFPSRMSIAESSACLELTEDTHYPLEPGHDKYEDSKWYLSNGNATFTMGQRSLKRRRSDTGDQMGDVSRVTYQKTSGTTMQKSSTFTLGGGFVNAGSHLRVLNEQQSNQSIRKTESLPTAENPKASIKRPKSPPTGQGTLLGFLGKKAPEKEIKPPQIVDRFQEEAIPSNAQLHRPRNLAPDGLVQSPSHSDDEILPPLLTGHRLPTGKALSRPDITRVQSKQTDSYVFLSSSPPRAKQPSPVMETDPGLTAKPAIMSLVRPASTLHTTTSMAISQGSGNRKKTLGLRRGNNGWSKPAMQPFTPPTRK